MIIPRTDDEMSRDVDDCIEFIRSGNACQGPRSTIASEVLACEVERLRQQLADLKRHNSDLTALLDEGLSHDRMVSVDGGCYSGCPKCQWEQMKGGAK